MFFLGSDGNLCGVTSAGGDQSYVRVGAELCSSVTLFWEEESRGRAHHPDADAWFHLAFNSSAGALYVYEV